MRQTQLVQSLFTSLKILIKIFLLVVVLDKRFLETLLSLLWSK